MRAGASFVIIAALLTLVGGPLMLIGSRLLQKKEESQAFSRHPARLDWRLIISSALLYTLAFNVIFFIQELFLVLPKALIPDLSPTLFHNNHSWSGKNPIAHLLQGTGAMTIGLVGTGSFWRLIKWPPQTRGARLFLIWIAYHGLFESLPQVVVGAFLPQNDVGMAMDYLGCSPLTMQLAALAALGALVTAGLGLTQPLLELSLNGSPIATQNERIKFIFEVATLPALLSLLLILPFRLPGSIDQVVLVPVAVTWIGISWIQAGAWRTIKLPFDGVSGLPPILMPLLGLIAVLLFFQLILRPGIAFY